MLEKFDIDNNFVDADIFYTIINIFRYIFIAGGAYLFYYCLFKKKYERNKIQINETITNSELKRELLASFQTIVVSTLFVIIFLYTPLDNYAKVYLNINDYPLWYIPVSVIIYLILQDTYFYWMHRLIHHPKLFRYVHLVHHKSNVISPFTGYTFHIFETLFETLILIVLLFIIPIHLIGILLYITIGFINVVYIHLGYEIAPKWFRHSFLFKVFISSTHHNLHHTKFKYNHGLYFRFWDRLMKTEDPHYVDVYDTIQERRFSKNYKNVGDFKD